MFLCCMLLSCLVSQLPAPSNPFKPALSGLAFSTPPWQLPGAQSTGQSVRTAAKYIRTLSDPWLLSQPEIHRLELAAKLEQAWGMEEEGSLASQPR